MQTKAAVLHTLNAPLSIELLTIPPLKPGQVLVDIAFSGVCHTQLMEIRGKKGPDRFLPHALGHEGAGIVREVASGVSKVKPGDRVVLSWIKGHGAEVPSTQYQAGAQVVNSGAVTTFMERAIVSENRLVQIGQTMPLREAALLGCAVPTGAGIVFNTLRARPGEGLVVFGCGGIGLSAVLGAHLMHSNPIVAVDVLDHKLALARRLGATHCVNSAATSGLSALHEIAPRGFDYAIEAAGRTETMEAAVAAVRPGGGVAVLAGNLAAGGRISLDPFDLIRGKRVVGTWGGETQTDRDIPLYAALHAKGVLDVDPLISRIYPLEDINEAMDALERGDVTGRALIEIAPQLETG